MYGYVISGHCSIMARLGGLKLAPVHKLGLVPLRNRNDCHHWFCTPGGFGICGPS